jgi:hypothetical protein
MKNVIALLISVAFTIITTYVNAQEHSPLMTIQAEEKLPTKEDNTEDNFHIGGRIGLGESKIKSDGLKDATGRIAVSGGLSANYEFNRVFALNADLLLTSVGARTEGASTERDILGKEYEYRYIDRIDLLFAEVPLTAQFTARVKNFFARAYVGPSANFKLIAIESRTYDDEEYNEDNGYLSRDISNMSVSNYSMIYGFGIGALDRNKKTYFLDFRISNGMSPIGKIYNATSRLNYYMISGGYYF